MPPKCKTAAQSSRVEIGSRWTWWLYQYSLSSHPPSTVPLSSSHSHSEMFHVGFPAACRSPWQHQSQVCQCMPLAAPPTASVSQECVIFTGTHLVLTMWNTGVCVCVVLKGDPLTNELGPKDKCLLFFVLGSDTWAKMYIIWLLVWSFQLEHYLFPP